MNGKKALVFALSLALLPQTAGALSVSGSALQPTGPQYNFAQVYNYRWAIQPQIQSQNISTYSGADNTGSSLGGGKVPGNTGSSLASRITIIPSNTGNSLGGGKVPVSQPDNTGGTLGGGRTPDNISSSLISRIKLKPENTSSSLASRITIKPDNTGGTLGGGRTPSTPPDNTNGSLGGGKVPDNTGQSLADMLASNSSSSSSSGRPDNTGSSVGSSSSDSTGSSERPDNTGPSLSGQLEENPYPGARPDNTGPSLQDQLDDQDDQDNDNDDDNEYTNRCDGRLYPRDIDGHWAEIYVRRLYDLCVVEGYSDGYFRPNAYVTRAELVKMGLFANGIEANHGCYDNDCGSPFYDLDSWQGQWVRPAYDRRIIQGYNLNEFRPNQPITRAEAVKVVLATYGYAPINTNQSFFKDVNGWSTGWIEAARVIGLVQGIGNGNFDPNRPITRAEAAKIIAKMIEHWDTNVSYDNRFRG